MDARIAVHGTDVDRASLAQRLRHEPELQGVLVVGGINGADLAVRHSPGSPDRDITWAVLARTVVGWLRRRRGTLTVTVTGPAGRRVTVSSARLDAAEDEVRRVLTVPVEPTRTGSTADGRLLHQCREAFGASPRRFDVREVEEYLEFPKPDWVHPCAEHAAHNFYFDLLAWQSELRRVGRIVWGRHVQANSLLFKPGDTDHPAAFIFSTDPSADDDPSFLAGLGRQLFAMKGTRQKDPELQPFADGLAAECDPDSLLSVPQSITGGREVFYTTALVCRRHLPDGYLTGAPFPLLVLPRRTTATLIVPSRYWPPGLVTRWRRGGD